MSQEAGLIPGLGILQQDSPAIADHVDAGGPAAVAPAEDRHPAARSLQALGQEGGQRRLARAPRHQIPNTQHRAGQSFGLQPAAVVQGLDVRRLPNRRAVRQLSHRGARPDQDPAGQVPLAEWQKFSDTASSYCRSQSAYLGIRVFRRTFLFTRLKLQVVEFGINPALGQQVCMAACLPQCGLLPGPGYGRHSGWWKGDAQ